MKDLDKTCADCPSREMLPDIAALMKHLNENYPDVSQRIQADGMSPMFGAVLALRTQFLQLAEIAEELTAAEEKIDALQKRLAEEVIKDEP